MKAAGRHAHVRPLFALPPTIPERLPIAKGEVTYDPAEDRPDELLTSTLMLW